MALAHPDSEHNGAYYQIQRFTLHLSAFVQLRVPPASWSRQCCRLAAVTHFDEHTGWLTNPFLTGHPPI